MNIDSAKHNFDELFLEVQPLLSTIRTEEDTRLQLIDRMLIEVLGWPRSEISAEPHTESGFIDYLLGASGGAQLVVEAKRLGTLLVDTKDGRFRYYKAGGPAIISARSGLEQAKRYCSDKAVLFSALTTGIEWIGFWALRTDRRPPYEGMAAVFPTLDAIADNFAEFYQLFGYECVREQLFEVLIHEAEGLALHPVELLESVLSPSEIHLIRRSDLATDLQAVFREFFSTISDETDPELLARCFVESRESREADITLEKITRELINSVDIVTGASADTLQQEIKHAAQSGKGEFVLIIGNKGAGKSTFIDRFFRLILQKPIRERCLVLRVDLAAFSGDLALLPSWLTQRLKDATEQLLFADGSPSFDQIKGAYFDEYSRWKKGTHRKLYERSVQEFDELFGSWVARQMTEQPHEYLMALLRQVTKSRKLMPCLVFDNADNHRQEIQEAVFQVAQSLFRSVYSFVICPVTDRTIWQLSKSGPLQSYDYRTFYLPVPSSKDVIAKRVAFIQEKSESAGSANYFTERGVRLTISNIKAFATCVERVFVQEDYVGRMVGWLSNHDIRRSLLIAQQIITSPWMKIEELVKAFVLEQDAHPPQRDTIRALIAGDYTHFLQSQSHYILNVFEVHPDTYCSPLIRLSILQFLLDRHVESTDVERLYVPFSDVVAYFEPAGVVRKVLRPHLSELMKWRLVEPYDPTQSEAHDHQRFRITHAGRLHIEIAVATQDGTYMAEMGQTTPIRDRQAIGAMRAMLRQGDGRMQWDDWQTFRWRFASYLIAEDKREMTLPSHVVYDSQRRLRTNLQQNWPVPASITRDRS